MPKSLLTLAALSFSLVLTAGCGRSGELGAPPPPAVTVAPPVVQEIIEWDEYTGRFEAIEYVETRARVSGYLESIHFYDGQIVEEGDLLFVIDKRPFQAALDQATGRAAEADARFQLTRNDRVRAEKLLKSNAVSREEYDQRLQSEKGAEAALRTAQAAVRAAELDLEFAEVRAPISGRVSDHRVSVGNLVSGGSANATVLTTIASLDPIHFVFDASDKAYLKYTRQDQLGGRPSSRDEPNPVFVKIVDEETFGHEGYMNFVDNVIDPNTGTMRGRAVFENPNDLLIPGVFGRLRLAASNKHEAILIPESAIQSDQSHKFVWVVNSENIVEYRPLTLGPVHDGNLRIVRDGLGPNDLIVVEGVQRVRPGVVVAPERAQPDGRKEEPAAIAAKE